MYIKFLLYDLKWCSIYIVRYYYANYRHTKLKCFDTNGATRNMQGQSRTQLSEGLYIEADSHYAITAIEIECGWLYLFTFISEHLSLKSFLHGTRKVGLLRQSRHLQDSIHFSQFLDEPRILDIPLKWLGTMHSSRINLI